MPKVQYRSNCKPSTFAYPPALEIPKEKEKEKVSAGAPLALVSLRKVVFFSPFPPASFSFADICSVALFRKR